jgi:hypothetical protein
MPVPPMMARESPGRRATECLARGESTFPLETAARRNTGAALKALGLNAAECLRGRPAAPATETLTAAPRFSLRDCAGRQHEERSDNNDDMFHGTQSLLFSDQEDTPGRIPAIDADQPE